MREKLKILVQAVKRSLLPLLCLGSVGVSGCIAYPDHKCSSRTICPVPEQYTEIRGPVHYDFKLFSVRKDLFDGPTDLTLDRQIRRALYDTELFSEITRDADVPQGCYNIKFSFLLSDPTPAAEVVAGATLFFIPIAQELKLEGTIMVFKDGNEVAKIERNESYRALLWLPMAPFGIFKNCGRAWRRVESQLITTLVAESLDKIRSKYDKLQPESLHSVGDEIVIAQTTNSIQNLDIDEMFGLKFGSYVEAEMAAAGILPEEVKDDKNTLHYYMGSPELTKEIRKNSSGVSDKYVQELQDKGLWYRPLPNMRSFHGFAPYNIFVDKKSGKLCGVIASAGYHKPTPSFTKTFNKYVDLFSSLGTPKRKVVGRSNIWEWTFSDRKARICRLSLVADWQENSNQWDLLIGVTIGESSERRSSKIAKTELLATGTGWFISSNILVTCYHVIDGGALLKCRMQNGTEASLECVAFDKENDLAVLKIGCGMVSSVWLPLQIKMLKLTDKVCTFGYPMPSLLGQDLKYTDGSVSGISGIANDPRVYQISVPLQPGNSGGALLNDDGYVVGITSSVLDAINAAKLTGTLPQNVNYATKVRYLTALLDDHGIDYFTDDSACGFTSKEISERAKATVMITVEK